MEASVRGRCEAPLRAPPAPFLACRRVNESTNSSDTHISQRTNPPAALTKLLSLAEHERTSPKNTRSRLRGTFEPPRPNPIPPTHARKKSDTLGEVDIVGLDVGTLVADARLSPLLEADRLDGDDCERRRISERTREGRGKNKQPVVSLGAKPPSSSIEDCSAS